jgi:hypothetical protein
VTFSSLVNSFSVRTRLLSVSVFSYIYTSLFRPCCTITTLFFSVIRVSLLNFFIYSCWLSPLNFSDFVILMVQFMGSKNVLSESVSNRENIPVKFEIEDHLEEQHAPLHKRCKVSNLSLNIFFFNFYFDFFDLFVNSSIRVLPLVN